MLACSFLKLQGAVKSVCYWSFTCLQIAAKPSSFNSSPISWLFSAPWLQTEWANSRHACILQMSKQPQTSEAFPSTHHTWEYNAEMFQWGPAWRRTHQANGLKCLQLHIKFFRCNLWMLGYSSNSLITFQVDLMIFWSLSGPLWTKILRHSHETGITEFQWSIHNFWHKQAKILITKWCWFVGIKWRAPAVKLLWVCVCKLTTPTHHKQFLKVRA